MAYAAVQSKKDVCHVSQNVTYVFFTLHGSMTLEPFLSHTIGWEKLQRDGVFDQKNFLLETVFLVIFSLVKLAFKAALAYSLQFFPPSPCLTGSGT